MSDQHQQSPFVVPELRPVNKDGQTSATYELNKASVSPQRIVGRDARGFPKLETMPTVFWKPFLMPDGCINKVPLRTGSVFSMTQEATAYENETVTVLILAGAIPAWLCPYSTKYTHLTDGPFATPEHGERDCGGSLAEGGCEHLQAIGAARREDVLKKYNDEMTAFAKSRDVEYERMRRELVDGLVEGVGEAVAKHMQTPQTPQQQAAAARQRIKDNRSDPGKVVEEGTGG